MAIHGKLGIVIQLKTGKELVLAAKDEDDASSIMTSLNQTLATPHMLRVGAWSAGRDYASPEGVGRALVITFDLADLSACHVVYILPDERHGGWTLRPVTFGPPADADDPPWEKPAP